MKNLTLYEILILLYTTIRIEGFSYNVNSKIIYSPKKTNGHSYFGYTTLLKQGDVPMIIVGAPRETSFTREHNSINDPGVIYTCDVKFNETNSICEQYILDIAGNTIQNDYGYYHRKDNMWLGMSMDGATKEDGLTVMCAPRWINQYHYTTFHGNGICYTIYNFRNATSANMLMPLVDLDKQTIVTPRNKAVSPYGSNAYYYAYGEAGVSSKMSDDGSEILFGAPGTYLWTGSVIKYKVTKYGSDVHISLQNIPNPYLNSELKTSSYLGYSVGFGKFMRNRKMLYVAGAPKGSNCKGEVIVFDFPLTEHARFNILAKLEGKQIGEYFGYSIATIDINRDGLTDLIIGAPTYATKSEWDVGRVYVYINQDNGNFAEQDSVLCGSCTSGSRFGSVISEIGDINGDAYKDVAIGSPYEDDGKGAVYIYLGNENGLNDLPVQRITVEGMQGFGISISKGVDIDLNSCNDIVIGAHDSGNAALFRCHPSTSVFPKLDTYPAELSINDTEFTTQICVKFQGTYYNTDLEFKVYPDKEYGRVTFNNREDSRFIMTGSHGVVQCKDILFNINEKEVDYSRPVDIQIKFDLKKDPMRESRFCSDCPVLRPNIKREIISRVPFAAGCGPDLICTPDLKVTLSTQSESPFIIGKSKSLFLTINLENIGEPAFLTKIELTIPKKTPISRVPSECVLNDVLNLVCDFESPMKADSKQSITVKFDAKSLKNTDELLTFIVNATSGGQEINPKDNSFVLDLKLISKFKLEMKGNFGANQFINIAPKNETLTNVTVVHSYEVLNSGPSTLDAINLTFFLPVMLNDPNYNSVLSLMNVKKPTAILNQQNMVCKPLTGAFLKDETTLEDPNLESINSSTLNAKIKENSDETMSYLLKNTNDNLAFDVYHLNCTNSTYVTCLTIQCSGTNLKPGTSGVQISFEMNLNTSNINEIIKRENAIILSSYAIAETESHQIRIVKWVNTLLVTSTPPTPPVPIWLYILGVLLGILSLAIITAIFYKCGFFERKTKENLDLLKNQENQSTETISGSI